jgi:hypothetical protein
VSYEAQLIRDSDAGLFDPSAQVDDSIISMDGNQGLDDWVIHFAK